MCKKKLARVSHPFGHICQIGTANIPVLAVLFAPRLGRLSIHSLGLGSENLESGGNNES